MAPKSETEVLIVGAGPVGMMAAASLERQGIEVLVVDRGFRPAARSYALALHPRTLELFDELGLARRIIDRGQPLATIALYDRHRRRAEIQLARLRSEFPFVLGVAQSAVEDILQDHLRSRGIPLLWNHRASLAEVAEDRVSVALASFADAAAGYGLVRARAPAQQLGRATARFVIGADGYWSAVRRDLELEYHQLGGTQIYGVFELEADWQHDGEVRVVLTDDTTNVLWPLGGGRCRWSFELTRSGLPPPRLKRRLMMQVGDEAYPYLAPADLADLIAARAPWFDAAIGEVSWSMAVRFEHRLVDRFGRDNVWLAGDAAHLAGPAGAHSMNVGIGEACDLGRRMAAILRRGEPRHLLAAYGDERMAEWRRLQGLDGMPATAAAEPWIHSQAARAVAAIPASGEHLRQLAEQLGLSL